MTRFSLFAPLAALSLAASPVAAQDSAQRTASPVTASEGLVGGSADTSIVFGFAALIAVFVIILSIDGDDEPASP